MPFDPGSYAAEGARQSIFDWAKSLPFEVNRVASLGLYRIVGDFISQVGMMWRQAAEYFPDIMDKAFDDCAKMVLDRARQLSGYEFYTLPELRRMGHPYSTRFGPGTAGIPDYIVNTHTGLFYGDWNAQVHKIGGEYVIQLDNDAPYAKFLFTGTTRMRQRPILEAAFEQTAEERATRVEEAVKEADP